MQQYNFSDLKVNLDKDMPITISMYRGEDFLNFQQALKDCATYELNNYVGDIFDLNLSDFQVDKVVAVGNMVGQSGIMFAVHDEGQLFFECESKLLTEDYIKNFRMQLLKHINQIRENVSSASKQYTILGWNSVYGGSFAIEVNYPSDYDPFQVNDAMIELVEDISSEHSDELNKDYARCTLFITNILEGHHANIFPKFQHIEGHDEYNFPKKSKEWTYSLTTNKIWFSEDHGNVTADTYEQAVEIAKKSIMDSVNEINKRLEGFSELYLNLDSIVVEEVKDGE